MDNTAPHIPRELQIFFNEHNKTCTNCGNQLEAYEGKKGKTYCSNECYKEHKGIGVKKFASCVVCGKEFELKHGMGTKVCSTECLKTLRSQFLSKPKKTSICKA